MSRPSGDHAVVGDRSLMTTTRTSNVVRAGEEGEAKAWRSA
jgi:hypothetical protein